MGSTCSTTSSHVYERSRGEIDFRHEQINTMDILWCPKSEAIHSIPLSGLFGNTIAIDESRDVTILTCDNTLFDRSRDVRRVPVRHDIYTSYFCTRGD